MCYQHLQSLAQPRRFQSLVMDKCVKLVIIIFVGLVVVSGAGFGFYRYRMRSYMDKEIRSIMSQYMPLEEENQA